MRTRSIGPNLNDQSFLSEALKGIGPEMKNLKEFEAELKRKNLAGYWETAEGEAYRQPHPSYKRCVWKSKDARANRQPE